MYPSLDGFDMYLQNQALLKKLVFDIPLFWFVPIFVICTRICYLYLLLIFALALYLLLLFVLAFVICTCFWIFVLAFVIYTYFWYLFFLLICTCFRFLHFSYLLFLYLLLSSRPPQNLLFTSSPSAFDLFIIVQWPLVSIYQEGIHSDPKGTFIILALPRSWGNNVTNNDNNSSWWYYWTILLIFWQLNDNQMIMATHPPHADQVWRGQIVRAQRSNGNNQVLWWWWWKRPSCDIFRSWMFHVMM